MSIYDPPLNDLLFVLKAMDDGPERQQAKLNCLIAIMENETANFSAGIYVPLLAGFAVAVGNTGIDPKSTLKQLHKHALEDLERQYREQGVTIAKGTRPN